MIAVLAVAVALLVTAGVHLLLERSLFRAVLGLSLLANAANLIVLSSGGAGEVSPMSSRKIVPPPATSNSPFFVFVARQ